MTPSRFILVGGFLGAGKTTTLTRLARYYQQRGQRVGLVTNDQAADLVDTTSLRAQGFAVAEVAGACFCCRFDELVDRVSSLETSQRPDVILAEPVGSCTDLVATVVQPLRDLYGNRFEVAPYAVLFKPSHGLKILRNEAGVGFSPKAAYIFRKQLEEADAVVINRIDELDPVTLDELARLVTEQFPGVLLLKLSARTGQGFDGLAQLLDQEGNFGRRILDINYDTYAEGEAELGWLNSTVHLQADLPFALDRFLLSVVNLLKESLKVLGAEVAHLKAIGLSDTSFGVANLVASGQQPEMSMPSRVNVLSTELVVNARVALDPAILEERVRQAITAAAQEVEARTSFRQTQSFRPGRPQPTHRYAAARA